MKSQVWIGKKRLKKPLIQGGMGIGVSLSGLAGAVAKEGGGPKTAKMLWMSKAL